MDAHFRDEEIAAMVEEAAAAGLFVMAHANGEGARNAVRQGVRSVEHGSFLDDETIEMMVERGTWLVPTLSAAEGILETARTEGGYPALRLEKVNAMAGEKSAATRKAIEAGVKIAMGTDAPLYPHGKNLRELELLADYGMSPEAVLHSAALSAAELMGVDGELGSLEPGKQADVVLVGGSASDVRGLGERVRAVWQDGALVDRCMAGPSVQGQAAPPAR